MDRRGWIDVALGALVAVASVTLWHFPLRDLWTRSIDIFGWSRPVLFLGTTLIIVFHLAWLAGTAHLATRSLQRSIDVWKRLYPVAAVVSASAWLTTAVEMLMRGRPVTTTPIHGEVAGALLTGNIFFTLMWIAAWVILRHRGVPSASEPPVIWRRPGPWIWVSVWAVGLALEYLV
ncbi:MAG: hypothetical protein ACOCZ7_02070 [Armatimonadota bacterium]